MGLFSVSQVSGAALPPSQAFVGAPSQASALVWDDFEFANEFLDMTGNNNNNK